MRKLVPSLLLIAVFSCAAASILTYPRQTVLADGGIPTFHVTDLAIITSNGKRRVEMKTALINHPDATSITAQYKIDADPAFTDFPGAGFNNVSHNAESFGPRQSFIKFGLPMTLSSAAVKADSTLDGTVSEILSAPSTGTRTTLLDYEIYRATLGDAVLLVPKIAVADGVAATPSKTRVYSVKYFAEGAVEGTQEWRNSNVSLTVSTNEEKLKKEIIRINCEDMPDGKTKLRLVSNMEGSKVLRETGEISVTGLCNGNSSSSSMMNESGMCTDAIDNDDDLDIDCADSDCSAYYGCISSSSSVPTSESLCADDEDNDLDEYKDCDDTDCANDPYCIASSSSSSATSSFSQSSSSFSWASSSAPSSRSSSSWGY